jgi:hypothetical protein
MDTDWVDNVSNIKSTSGFMFSFEVVLLVGVVKNNQQLHY